MRQQHDDPGPDQPLGDPARRHGGLCSVTFRHLSADQVIATAGAAGLEAIEWGADVHVTGPREADRVGRRTAEAGLRVASYGSYYRVGGPAPEDFAGVLAGALALGAPRVRVWAGITGSAEADLQTRRQVARDARRIGGIAADAGVRIGLEYHDGTLADTPASTADLLEAVDLPNVGTYWQPPVGLDDDAALRGLEFLLDRVQALHVFSWWPRDERHPLSARADLWRRVFALVHARGRDLDALLEFVPADDPSLLPREAATLRELFHR